MASLFLLNACLLILSLKCSQKIKKSDNEIEFNDDNECHEFEVFQLREH